MTSESPSWSIDALIGDLTIRTVICCGSGGVGKTTTAAAIAVRAAEMGRRVVVLTIDPARRLAQALGLADLDNTPHRVPGIDEEAGGSLDAMMLDMKRTFDDIVEAHATPEKAEQLLANPFYQALSSSFAGTQEYMAMEKLGQLRAAMDLAEKTSPGSGWDLIVVDTPPSRSALDFLDAPARLSTFLDGRFAKILTAPAKTGGRAYLRAFSAGVSTVTHAVSTVIGARFLTDVQTFVTALDTMFGGFRERADTTYRSLQENGTAFCVVATPDRDALREATYFVRRLRADGMPLAGLILNRTVRKPPGAPLARGSGTLSGSSTGEVLSADRVAVAAEQLSQTGEHSLAAAILQVYAAHLRSAEQQHTIIARFSAAHADVPVRPVRARSRDVHDLPALRLVGNELAGNETTCG
ncbi:MAG: ArsA family ATPase [Actinomycetota bacterium]